MADAVKPVKWALEGAVLDARIPPSGKLIMLVLLAKASPESPDLGRYSPGTRKLADQTGLKRDTVIKYLGLLEQHGWLTVRQRAGKRAEYALSEGRAFQAAAPRKAPRTGPVSRTAPAAGGPVDGTATGPCDGTATGPVDGTAGVPSDGTMDRSLTKDRPGMTASQTVSPPGEGKAGHTDEELHPAGCTCFDCIFTDDAGSAGGEAGIK